METHLSGKIGAKKLRKLEEKQARKAQREASRRGGVQLCEVGKGPMVDPPFEDLCMLGWCLLLAGFVSCSLGLWPGPGIVCPGLFGGGQPLAGGGDVPL